MNIYKVEQYPGNPPTFGVALFEVRADSWYCGTLLPRRLGGNYQSFGNDAQSAHVHRSLRNVNGWRYVVKDLDGETLGCTDSYEESIEFARGITGARSTIADYERRLVTTRIHDRDEQWRCIHELNSHRVKAQS